MTNKTEMVSVPRELLKRWKSNMQGIGLQDMPAQIDAILAAPAEDARGVVDEPVAWLVEGGRTWADRLFDAEKNADICLAARNDGSFKTSVYRHPHRPVVMPERLREVWLFLDGQAELEGCVFGEKPEGCHSFWWRKELRAALEELFPQQ